MYAAWFCIVLAAFAAVNAKVAVKPTDFVTTSTPPTTRPTEECVIPEQVFMACGTACPAVCGEERPMFCAAMCVSECQCPPGMFLDRTQNQCVTDCPTEITPTTEVDPTTSDTVTTTSGTRPLTTGSAKPTDSASKPTPGTGSTSTPRPGTGSTTSTPVATATMSGTRPPTTGSAKPTDSTTKPTPGTGSTFTISRPTTAEPTIDGSGGIVPEVCRLEPDQGPCKGNHRRYHFNITSDQCEPFMYGGCGGNGNNFRDLAECQAVCLREKPTETIPIPENIPESSGEEECGIRGQEFMECGSACPPVCGEERPMLCAAMCVRECQCPPGLFLDRSLPACVDTCSTVTPPTTGTVTKPTGTVASSKPTSGTGTTPSRPGTEKPTPESTTKPTPGTASSTTSTTTARPSDPTGSTPTRPSGSTTSGTPTDVSTSTTDKPTTITDRPTSTADTPSTDVTTQPTSKPTTTTITTTTEPVDICRLPKDTGYPCQPRERNMRRYYYNSKKQACQPFAYSGCGGNDNRFGSMEECRNTCMP